MKEYSIYFKGRPLDLSISITNLKFKDMLSIKHGVILKNYVTGFHGRLRLSVSPNKIGVLSSIGSGEKRSAVSIAAPITILTDVKDTKRSIASMDTTVLALHCSGGATSVACVRQDREISIGLNSDVGELNKVISEKVNEKISILGGKYRLLNEYDDSALEEMDSEILHDLDRFEILVLHELNHEVVDNSAIFSCEGVMTGRVYVGLKPSVMQVQDEVVNSYMVLYRTLYKTDSLGLCDMDSMTMEQLNYIEVG